MDRRQPLRRLLKPGSGSTDDAIRRVLQRDARYIVQICNVTLFSGAINISGAWKLISHDETATKLLARVDQIPEKLQITEILRKHSGA